MPQSRPWPCALHTSGAPVDTSVDTVAEVGRVNPSGAWPEVRTGGHSGAILANQRWEVTPGPSRPCGPRLAPDVWERPASCREPWETEPNSAEGWGSRRALDARRGPPGHRAPPQGVGSCLPLGGTEAAPTGRGPAPNWPNPRRPPSASPPLPGVQDARLRGWGAQGQGAPGASRAPGLRGAGRTPMPRQRRTPLPGAPRSLRSGPGKAGSRPRFMD